MYYKIKTQKKKKKESGKLNRQETDDVCEIKIATLPKCTTLLYFPILTYQEKYIFLKSERDFKGNAFTFLTQ